MALFPNYILQFSHDDGTVAAGAQLFFYEVGGTTKKNTTDGNGGSINPNPIILDSAGRPDNSGTAIDIYLADSESYKIVLAPAGDTDPPTSPIRPIDNLLDVAGEGQWRNARTATYIDADNFSVTGNQTVNYAVGVRVKTTGGADRYSRISASSYSDPITTVTVVDTRDASGNAQSLHASLSLSKTHINTPEGVRGAVLIEGIADAAGTVDALTATFYPPLVLADKVTCLVRATGATTITNPTFAPDSATAKTITKLGNDALAVGDITGAGHVLILQYSSANDVWELLNPQGVGSIGATDATGTADAITATFSVAVSLTDKTTVFVRASGANTITNPTFQPTGTVAKTIVKYGNTALAVGNISAAGHILLMQYSSANDNWELLNPEYDDLGGLASGADFDAYAVGSYVEEWTETVNTVSITTSAVIYLAIKVTRAGTVRVRTYASGTDLYASVRLNGVIDTSWVPGSPSSGTAYSTDIVVVAGDIVSYYMNHGGGGASAYAKMAVCCADPILAGQDFQFMEFL